MCRKKGDRAVARDLARRRRSGGTEWGKFQLTSDYKDDKSEVEHFLKHFFGLAFLNACDVENSFIEDLMAMKPNSEKVEKFCDYILETYITLDSDFPPHMWAEFSATINRTTSGCECFHSKFNSLFYKSAPNIYNFVEALKQVQCLVYIKMRSSGKNVKQLQKKKNLFQT